MDQEKASKVTSAYLLNFILFTEWQPEHFEDDHSPINITVIGHESHGEILNQTMANASVRGRKINVYRLGSITSLRQQVGLDNAIIEQQIDELLDKATRSHLLYVTGSEEQDVRTILQHMEGNHALTVGGTRGFAENGGMIGLVLRQGKIVFEANLEMIKSSNLRISSKVLRLARIVKTKQ